MFKILADPLGKGNPRVDWLSFCNHRLRIGKNRPDKVITNVKVMFHLSVRPLIGTDWGPQLAIVNLLTETYGLGA